jgi:V8-like Glu-specific endopeptidase
MKLFSTLAIFMAVTSVNAAVKNSTIIYGVDNRLDVIENPAVKDISQAIAGRVNNWSFQVDRDNNNKTLKTLSFLAPPKLSDPWGGNVCTDERFADQTVLADCTGFLIGEDTLVTAGHCMTDFKTVTENKSNHFCEEFSWVFDYKADAAGQVQLERVSSERLFRCKKVIYAVLDEKNDYAVIQLDRKAVGRTPLKFRKEGKAKDKQSIFVVGHPSGLPMKVADNAKVINNDINNYFSTNLDTFGGNSGSPVFNAQTLEVEGILVRGRTDYVPSPIDGERCMRVNTCDQERMNCNVTDEDINGEHVTRITEILKHL